MQDRMQVVGPVESYSRNSKHNGLEVKTTAQLLRRYACVERGLMRMLAGWFLAAPAYEVKHAFGYHLMDYAEHTTWLRQRLTEMRGGQPNSSVEPALMLAVEQTVHAATAEHFVAGAYLELTAALADCYRDHLAGADPSANAAEIRILQRSLADLERHVAWAEKLLAGKEQQVAEHRAWIRGLIGAAGGISGMHPVTPLPERPASATVFQRPTTIVFDARVRKGGLMSYDQRQHSDEKTATVEQFKVFFNEMYAAALLASVLYDADPADVPWEFFGDFSHHFWDEVRHSEFGAIRLKELGTEPDVCNPVLYELSQGLPVLHRVAYLTMGLETYFMPRKGPRVREYAQRGDHRSQLFADQDWSDETMHVRYGKRWLGHLLENDFRSVDDVLEEVKQHLEQQTGQKQESFAAPF